MFMKKYNVAIVGSTGLVGRMFIKVLEELDFPVKSIYFYASKRSIGRKIVFKNKDYNVQELNENSFKNIDLALFSAGSEVALKYVPIAKQNGALVIDNSSAFRMKKDIPLIVPEINIQDYKMNRIIANPNCSTIQVSLPLKALDDAYGISQIYYSTYQAISGKGQKGIEDYYRCLNQNIPQVFPYDITSTCIPEIDISLSNGYTKEEMKMVEETKKILHRDDLLISSTCVRVPVLFCHGVVVRVILDNPFTIDSIREVLSKFPGIKVIDDLENHLYPNSIISHGTDEVYVGRIRRDLIDEKGLLFYCVADNIRKGSASNAVQIALELAKMDKI